MEWEFNLLKKTIKELLNFDPDNYKERPFKRRLNSRMRSLKVTSYAEYARIIRTDKEELERLKNALTINVTKFFRNREVFKIIQREILPELDEPVDIWSAGCATGEEPYTLAIILLEARKKGRILATDVDEQAIEKAKRGVYNEFSFEETPYFIKTKYFDRSGDNYIINERVKEMVEFQVQDLKELFSFHRLFDIILCSNVLIYFSKDFQEELMKEFYRRLKSGGYLILGKVEGMFGQNVKLFRPYNLRERIYRKA